MRYRDEKYAPRWVHAPTHALRGGQRDLLDLVIVGVVSSLRTTEILGERHGAFIRTWLGLLEREMLAVSEGVVECVAERGLGGERRERRTPVLGHCS